MYGSWQLLSRTRHGRASSNEELLGETAESLRFSLGVGDSIRFSRTVERRSVSTSGAQFAESKNDGYPKFFGCWKIVEKIASILGE